MGSLEQTELLTLGDYVAVIRRRAWLILIITLVCSGLGLLYASQKRATSTATVPVATSFVQPPSVTGSASGVSPNSTYAARFLANQAAFARSISVLDNAANSALAQRAAPGITPVQLARASSVTPSTTADVLDFTVTNRHGDVATQLARAYAFAYVVERRTSLEKQYQAIIGGLRSRESRLEAVLADPNASQATIRSIRPTLSLVTHTLGAFANYIQQADAAVQVEQTASGPAATSASPVKYGAVALIAGLVLALVIAFIRDALDSRLRSQGQLTTSLELPVLATIPTPPRHLRRANKLVTITGTDAQAEPFRMLAARLKLLPPTRDMRVILVTSALEGEGKSTTAANLGVALAEMGEAVVLVDGDLVRPKAASFFGLETGDGLADVAAGHARLADVTVPVPLDGSAGSLAVVSSGRSAGDPTSLLASDSLRTSLRALAEGARYVIIDSPPLLTISHATVLTASSDAILVVARADNLRVDVANDLRLALDALSTPKLGVVLTAADSIRAYGYYAPTFGSFQRAPSVEGGNAGATAAAADPADGLLRSEDDVGRIRHAT